MKLLDFFRPAPLDEQAVDWVKQLVGREVHKYIVNGEQIPPLTKDEAEHLIELKTSGAWRDLQECDRAELVKAGFRKPGGLPVDKLDDGPDNVVAVIGEGAKPGARAQSAIEQLVANAAHNQVIDQQNEIKH